MYTETRVTYRDEDTIKPEVEADTFANDPNDKVVRINISQVFVSEEQYMNHQLHMVFGLENAKLLVAKLQEGIDEHENKA